MSAALFAYVTVTYYDSELQNALFNVAMGHISAGRLEKIEEEKREIARLDSGEAVVRYMRSSFDMMNFATLANKAVTMEDEVLPLVLERFRTSGQERFIEAAVYVLDKSQRVYIDRLKAMYADIRNPYAQSLACMVFGMKKCEDTLPLLLSEYERMKREYPDKSFCQGPLLAIYLLYDEY